MPEGPRDRPHLRPRTKKPAERTSPLVVYAAFLLAVGLAGFKLARALDIGPAWDAYAFLANAAEWAGRGFGYSEPHRPVFISWVTSVPMRFGIMDAGLIQVVDVGLSLIAAAAFYLVMRRRFPSAVSAGGAIALLIARPSWEWLGAGYTDLPSVGLSLLALYLLVRATEEDDRWYWAAGACFVAAILTRYTALMAVFPLLVWLALRARPLAHAKRIGQAVLAGAALYVPAALFYARGFGDALFPFLMASSMSESTGVPGGEAFVSEAGGWWYLRNAAPLLGPSLGEAVTWLIFVLGLWGLLGAAWRHLFSSRPTAAAVTGAVLAIGLAVGAQLGGGLAARQLTIAVAVIVVWRLLARDRDESTGRIRAGRALDASVLAWLLAYLDFHGHQSFQVARYVIPMAPALIYLAALGWTSLAADADPGAERTPSPLRRAVMLPLVAWLLLAAATTVATTPSAPPGYAHVAETAARWIEQDGGLDEDAVVLSDLWPATAWHLKRSVSPMPGFTDDAAFEHELRKTRARYYLTYRSPRWEGYDAALTVRTPQPGEVYHVLVPRTEYTPSGLPSVQHLGTAWPSYLESLMDYSIELHYTAGLEAQHGWTGSAFLDAYTAEELAAYDAVFVYGVRWRDRGAGEDALRAYVEGGGTAVIDASSNLDGMWHSLRDVVMYDTVIRSATLPRQARVTLDAEFAERHPELRSGISLEFLDESGGPWTGAEYTPLDSADRRTVLVALDGRPAITEQRIGRGRVIWIAYNLVWHAFSAGEEHERAILRAVLDDAASRRTVTMDD